VNGEGARLGVADLVVIAARLLGRAPAALLGELTPEGLGVLDEAAAQAERSERRGPAAQAAALVVVLVRGRPFPARNRAVAILAAVHLLGRAGLDARLEPVAELDELLARVAEGRAGVGELADWLGARLRPRPAGADPFGDPEPGPPWSWSPRYHGEVRALFTMAGWQPEELDPHTPDSEHVLLAMAKLPACAGAGMLARLGISAVLIQALVQREYALGWFGAADAGARLRRIVAQAGREADRAGREQVTSAHLLIALAAEPTGLAARILEQLGAGADRLRKEAEEPGGPRLYPPAGAEPALLWGDDMWTGGPDPEPPPGPPPGPPSWLPNLPAMLDRLFGQGDEREREQSAEVERLRALLRWHGIDPDTDTGPGGAVGP
jgi:hypothetical protein